MWNGGRRWRGCWAFEVADLSKSKLCFDKKTRPVLHLFNGVRSTPVDFQQEGQDMRKLACLLLLAGGAFGLGGCASPAYTGGENLARTMRTISGLHVQMPERDLQVLSSPARTGLDQDDEPTIPGPTPRHLEAIR